MSPDKACRNCGRPEHQHGAGEAFDHPNLRGPRTTRDHRCPQGYEPLGWEGVARLQARGRFPR